MKALRVTQFVLVLIIGICIWIVLSAILSGCTQYTPRARTFENLSASEDKVEPTPYGFTDAQCYSLMKSRDHWMFTAKLLGGVGGLGALSVPPFENDTARWSIAASAATLGVAGIAAAWVGGSKSEEFERFCVLEPR